MQWIETWFPLVIAVRQGQFDDVELRQLDQGFERLYKRRTPFALLSVAERQAPPMDVRARQRFAQWANQPRIRRSWKELCAGSVTVVAGEADRHSLTALLWLWTPAAPHDSVGTIAAGVDGCISRLLARKVALPTSSHVLRDEVCRVLSALPVSGLEEKQQAPSYVRPRQRSGSYRIGRLEKVTSGKGSFVLGWLGAKVLWGSFHGHLSVELAETYATQLERLLRPHSKGITYFGDSSAIDSCDLVARTLILRALIEHGQRFSSLRILNWAGGVSSTGESMLSKLGSVVAFVDTREQFERLVAAAVPGARAIIDACVSGEANPRVSGA